MLKFPLNEGLSVEERWIQLKELQAVIKLQLEAIEDEMKELVVNGDVDESKVKLVKKQSVKMADSINKFLDNKNLLNLVRKDDIDLGKVNQLVEAGIIDAKELEEHLIRKETTYLKKGK